MEIQEHFDVNHKEWTLSKCRWFLRFIQKNPTSTRIEKEPGEEHLFLPKYLTSVIGEMDCKFYEWKSSDLNKIFVAIFRFLQNYYLDINRLSLRTINKNKRDEWAVEYPKYLKDKRKNKEAIMQNQFIEKVNNKWLPGFKYLYDFEYRSGDHQGDLIFANNYGILAVVETKRGFFNPEEKLREVKKQAIKYRDITMNGTKDDQAIIAVIGVYFIRKKLKRRKGLPLVIDKQIWKAIKSTYKFNNEKPQNSDQQSIAPAIGAVTIREFDLAAKEASDAEIDEINEITDGLEGTFLD